jgi:glutamate---cysteine ligase / carboxylate-amine ligase
LLDHNFTGPAFTVGIEEELMILDGDSCELAQEIERIIEGAPPEIEGQVKRELMQSVLEIATKPHDAIPAAGEELRSLRRALSDIAGGMGLAVAAAGTHPFALWEEQLIVDDARYHQMVDYLGYIARSELIFGTHVHVGMDDPEKAIAVADGLRRWVPLFLALSVNSPLWRGMRTGLMSTRTTVLRVLPRIGVPPHFGSWERFSDRVERLMRSGAIENYTYLWWDIRPHPNLGTVEIRAFDQQTSVEHTVALAALGISLCHQLASDFDAGKRVEEQPTELIDESKIQAAVRGMDAELIDLATATTRPMTEVARDLLERLRDHASELGCADELEGVRDLLDRGTEATRQLALLHENDGEYARLARALVEQARP